MNAVFVWQLGDQPAAGEGFIVHVRRDDDYCAWKELQIKGLHGDQLIGRNSLKQLQGVLCT